MGCDIHGMFERKDKYGWVNAGRPDLHRNYELFSVLGNVRNCHNIPYISFERISDISEDALLGYFSHAFAALVLHWAEDGHSHSFVTLEELKNYDLGQEYYDARLVLDRDEDGKITTVCAATSGKHLGHVGKHKIFDVFGDQDYQDLISYGETIRTYFKLEDSEIRFCFFFDN